MSNQQIDWESLETEYVTGKDGYRAIAARHGVSESAINAHGKRDKWPQKRKEHRSKVKARAQQKIQKKQADELAKLKGATNDAIGIVAKALGQERQFYTYLTPYHKTYSSGEYDDDTGEMLQEVSGTEQQQFDKLDTKSLKDATGILKDLVQLQRDFYNIPTQAQAEQQRIAAGRFELERQKAEADKQDGNEIVVVFDDGAPEAWNE